MRRHDDLAQGAMDFESAMYALGSSTQFPDQPKPSSSPILRALRAAGTAHVYVDSASSDEVARVLETEADRVPAEVDGCTINQPLLAKVLGSYLDDGDPAAWLEALRRFRSDLPDRDVCPLLYSIALARAGNDLVRRFAGKRGWELSLQLHMDAVGDLERSLAWGRCLRSMAAGSLVKVPFTPSAPECLAIARALENEGIGVNLTSTFSARQVAAAAILGRATRTNIFMGRLDQGLDAEKLGAHVGLESQRLLRGLRDEYGLGTRLIVASLRSWESIVQTAGCDVYTVPPDVLAGLLDQHESAAEALTSRLETSYEDELGIGREAREALGNERIARLWRVEPEFVEFLLEYDRSGEFADDRDGAAIARRFESAGFGDFFHAPSEEERRLIRREKVPAPTAPLAQRVALDTLYSLHANADFCKHQAEIDHQITQRLDSL